MLTKIKIFGYFDQNRHICKFWPQSTFVGNFDQNQDLGEMLSQIDFTEDID